MGTMVAINARSIDGIKPTEKCFYYNNNRNHFWRVLQHLLEPKKHIEKFTIAQKKEFLNKHGVAIINLVEEVEVKKSQIHDPSDTVLFEAFKRNKIKFKKIPKAQKDLLKSCPIYFTCRSKPGIKNLLEAYREHNNLPHDFMDRIWFLATPTRCNPEARAKMWKMEMKAHEKTLS
jgi:hypothetical protein